jgi:hypothetical protein
MVEVGKKAAEEYPRRRMECSSDGGDSQLNGVEEWMMSGIWNCDCLDGGPESQR